MNWWYYEIFYVGKVSQMDVNFKILGSLSSSFFCLLTKRVVSALELNQQENSFPNRKVYTNNGKVWAGSEKTLNYIVISAILLSVSWIFKKCLLVFPYIVLSWI